MEKTIAGKIKKNNEENGRIFIQALKFAYEDNNYDGDEAVAEFEKLFKGFSGYVRNISEEDLKKKGFGFYACVYIAEQFVPTRDKQEDLIRFEVIHEIAIYLFKAIDKYFEDTFKKVRLIEK